MLFVRYSYSLILFIFDVAVVGFIYFLDVVHASFFFTVLRVLLGFEFVTDTAALEVAQLNPRPLVYYNSLPRRGLIRGTGVGHDDDNPFPGCVQPSPRPAQGDRKGPPTAPRPSSSRTSELNLCSLSFYE